VSVDILDYEFETDSFCPEDSIRVEFDGLPPSEYNFITIGNSGINFYEDSYMRTLESKEGVTHISLSTDLYEHFEDDEDEHVFTVNIGTNN